MTELDPAGLGAAAKAVAAYVGWPPGFRRDAEAAVRAYLASLPPDAEKNPYGPASHTSADTAWDEGYAEGFAAGRGAERERIVAALEADYRANVADGADGIYTDGLHDAWRLTVRRAKRDDLIKPVSGSSEPRKETT